MSFMLIFEVSLFALVFLLLTMDKINATLLALLGGFSFILLGIINQEKAFLSIDWNVVFLLVGMMIIVTITKRTGIFQYVAIKMAKLAKGEPFKIMALLFIVTALFSAILDNVTTVLILTPISILIAVELGLSPIPFIISQAIASNIGGTATLIGDPPNTMIGSAAGLSFMDFIIHLAPLVIVLLFTFFIFAYIVWGRNLSVPNERKARIMEFNEKKFFEDIPLLIKSMVVLTLVVAGFLLSRTLHLEVATIAMAGAALLILLSGHRETEKLLEEVEWGSIFFFIGLFVMVGGLVELGFMKIMAEVLMNLTAGSLEKSSYLILWGSGVISALVNNIPFVATMIPLIKEIGTSPEAAGNAANIMPLWWSLALGACIGGNGTLVGASANVIAAGVSGKNGYKISFMEFTKYGAIITTIHIAICHLYIYIRYY